MNPVIHSKISVKKRGGQIDDYYGIHSFMDATKEVCSDNRHRILHTHWGIKRVIIPIFGHTIVNSVDKEVNVKDLCEQDHILPDYNNKFIPTLLDFTDELDELSTAEKHEIDRIYQYFGFSKAIQELLLSPLSITGQLKSLRLTYTGWFCNEIIPKIYPTEREKIESKIRLFEKMNFATWMDNGIALPKSVQKISSLL
ncbi:MAG: hypothetical protein MI974_14545 [Chitinophagales bacterium]|nr:hypothetical protein [Chitinophagales bacterium]